MLPTMPVVLELSIAKTEQIHIVRCSVRSETGDDRHNVTLKDVRPHRLEYKLDVICVCGTCEVRVNVLGAARDSVDKHLGNELSGLLVVSFRACDGRGGGVG